MPATLSDSILTDFRRDGFCVARGLLSEAEVAAIRDTFMAANVDGPVAGLSDIPKPRAGVASDAATAAAAPTAAADPLAFYPRMMHPHRHLDKPVGAVAMRYMLDARIESILSALMGEEPLAVQTMFYFKPPGARGQDFHQDNFYLKVKPGTCMAAWIACDDCDAENGGMMCVPETGAESIHCPEQADLSVSFTTEHVRIPEGKTAVLPKLKAGDVLFFNGSTIHGSGPNKSTSRFRRSLIAHYVPRSTAEMSHWYQAIDFRGQPIQMKVNQDGGPCGTVAASAPH